MQIRWPMLVEKTPVVCRLFTLYNMVDNLIMAMWSTIQLLRCWTYFTNLPAIWTRVKVSIHVPINLTDVAQFDQENEWADETHATVVINQVGFHTALFQQKETSHDNL